MRSLELLKSKSNDHDDHMIQVREDLELGMDITNWPPENVEELARRLDEPF